MLASGQMGETAHGLGYLLPPDSFQPLAKGDDGRHGPQGTPPGQKALHLLLHDGVHLSHLALTLLGANGAHGVQVVDVVQVHAVYLSHRRIDIGRDSDVYEEDGTAVAPSHGGPQFIPADDGQGSAAGADDDIGVREGLGQAAEGNSCRVQLLGQFGGPVIGAIGDSQAISPSLNKAARGEGAGFAHPHHQHLAA